MWERYKKHWIVAVVVSVAIMVGAIVAFFSSLAAIWGVLSHDTVPEFIETKGWTMTGWMSGPPWMNLTVIVVAVAVLIAQIGLLRQVYTQRVYASGQVDRETLTRYESERDQAVQGLRKAQEDFGHERLVFFSPFLIGAQTPTVTIRWVGHGPDFALVQQIERVFSDFTRWSVELDGKNEPMLCPDATLKVVFELDAFEKMAPVARAFIAGQLLGVSTGVTRTDRMDSHHLIVRVLPSA